MQGVGYVEVELRRHTRLLHPKLVALIVSVDASGRPNFMPAAWLTPVSVKPPLVAVAVAPERYTYSLVKSSGVFTVNPVDAGMLRVVEEAGSVSGRDVDKASSLGVRFLPALRVGAPCIEGALACLECRLWAEYPAGDHSILVGEVQAARARRDAWSGAVYDLAKARLLLHLGGDEYATASRLG
ncbi:flavin reductase family protein [Thermofilum pendens]|uniref:Flavin reductase domain protein, FMN-binding n=1 Tax=Thermofilum pendens (strain DSM 2475 / Hrk 5) TaxID=368408 RepID=A1RZA9_THEPD|nr:flavin reductase family protein [Thermofilum pendens]ABL78539.1 flavin reductase domain protein, FMN-binding [Thermofilum pendens Hrk 5]